MRRFFAFSFSLVVLIGFNANVALAATAGLTVPGIPDGTNAGLRNLHGDKLLVDPESDFGAGVVDNTLGVALFATANFPTIIVKVSLGGAGVPPTRIGSIPLNFGEDYVRSAV